MCYHHEHKMRQLCESKYKCPFNLLKKKCLNRTIFIFDL